jgi:hypothetical protein
LSDVSKALTREGGTMLKAGAKVAIEALERDIAAVTKLREKVLAAGNKGTARGHERRIAAMRFTVAEIRAGRM